MAKRSRASGAAKLSSPAPATSSPVRGPAQPGPAAGPAQPAAAAGPAAAAPDERIVARLREFLVQRHPAVRVAIMQMATDRQIWRVVNSMTLLDMVDFVEVAFGVEVSALDFIPENFATLARVSRFVTSRGGPR